MFVNIIILLSFSLVLSFRSYFRDDNLLWILIANGIDLLNVCIKGEVAPDRVTIFYFGLIFYILSLMLIVNLENYSAFYVYLIPFIEIKRESQLLSQGAGFCKHTITTIKFFFLKKLANASVLRQKSKHLISSALFFAKNQSI